MDAEETRRIERLFEYERRLWHQGCLHIAGVDEVGRGPLAGPVVAAAVIFAENPGIHKVDDSKKLNEAIREELFEVISDKALSFGIGMVDVDEIDRINIYQASFLAMRKAIAALRPEPDHLLVDGRAFPENGIPFTTIVKGDSRSYSIAAASILAKVHRDRVLKDYDEQFPQYGFGNHKGYATREHLDAIEQFGYCPIHRRSFHPKRFQLCLAFDD